MKFSIGDRVEILTDIIPEYVTGEATVSPGELATVSNPNYHAGSGSGVKVLVVFDVARQGYADYMEWWFHEKDLKLAKERPMVEPWFSLEEIEEAEGVIHEIQGR